MATNHFNYDKGSQFGNLMFQTFDANEQADLKLQRLWQLWVDMRPVGADGTQDAHFDEHVRKFFIGGYIAAQGAPTAAQLTEAHNMWLELDSMYSKTKDDSAVTFVHTARVQAYSKFRA